MRNSSDISQILCKFNQTRIDNFAARFGIDNLLVEFQVPIDDNSVKDATVFSPGGEKNTFFQPDNCDMAE
jgi:hypothetical protein